MHLDKFFLERILDGALSQKMCQSRSCLCVHSSMDFYFSPLECVDCRRGTCGSRMYSFEDLDLLFGLVRALYRWVDDWDRNVLPDGSSLTSW